MTQNIELSLTTLIGKICDILNILMKYKEEIVSLYSVATVV
jgi:hypothetical protein